MLSLSRAEAVELIMPSTNNNCLLHALIYDGGPRGSNASDASLRALRQAIATAVIAHRDYDLNGKTLKAWVRATSGMDLESWAAEFAASDAMSDQIVLRIWPFFRGEAVWVWQPSRAGGYEHHSAYRFGAPMAKKVRHVLYRPTQLHFNALQVVQPAALERPAVPIKPAVRPKWVQPQSRAEQQKLATTPTFADCNEARATPPKRSTLMRLPYSNFTCLRAASSPILYATMRIGYPSDEAEVPADVVDGGRRQLGEHGGASTRIQSAAFGIGIGGSGSGSASASCGGGDGRAESEGVDDRDRRGGLGLGPGLG